MTAQEVLTQLTPIFIDILDNKNIALKPETTAKDIEEWDSITYIQLIVAIEKHFKIKFTSIEVSNFKNVGEMCETIIKRLKK
ncbi:MAG: acyl carrier protein [Bacteroidales bacterium]|jgi:acyl carrier protein